MDKDYGTTVRLKKTTKEALKARYGEGKSYDDIIKNHLLITAEESEYNALKNVGKSFMDDMQDLNEIPVQKALDLAKLADMMSTSKNNHLTMLTVLGELYKLNVEVTALRAKAGKPAETKAIQGENVFTKVTQTNQKD